MNGTRPDLAYVLNRLSQYNSKPTKNYSESATDMFRYINGIINAKLIIRRLKTPGTYNIEGYLDSSWKDNHDGTSILGGLLFLNGNLILWNISKQKRTSTLTTEAKYFSSCNIAKYMIWLYNILKELGLSP